MPYIAAALILGAGGAVWIWAGIGYRREQRRRSLLSADERKALEDEDEADRQTFSF